MSGSSKRVPINAPKGGDQSPDSSNHLLVPGPHTATSTGRQGSNLAFSPLASASGFGGSRSNNSPSLRAAALTALGYRGTEQGYSDDDEDNEVRIDVNQVARKLNIPVHAISRKIRDATEGGDGSPTMHAGLGSSATANANVGSYKAPAASFLNKLTGNTSSANNRKKSQLADDDETNARLISDDVREGILTEEVVPSFRVRRALGANHPPQQRTGTAAVPIAPSREGSPALRPQGVATGGQSVGARASQSIQRSRPQSFAMSNTIKTNKNKDDLKNISSGAYEVQSEEEDEVPNYDADDNIFEDSDDVGAEEDGARGKNNTKAKKSTFSFVQNVKQRHFKLVRAGGGNKNYNSATDDEERNSGSEAGPRSLQRHPSLTLPSSSYQSQGLRGASSGRKAGGGHSRGATYMAVQASDEDEEEGGDDDESSRQQKRKGKQRHRNYYDANETGSIDGEGIGDGGNSTDGSTSTYGKGAKNSSPRFGPSSPSKSGKALNSQQTNQNAAMTNHKSSDYDSGDAALTNSINNRRPSALSMQRKASRMDNAVSVDVNVIEDEERRAHNLAKIDAELQKGLKEGRGKNHDAVTFLSLTQEKSGDIFVSMKRQSATVLSRPDDDEERDDDEDAGTQKNTKNGDDSNYFDDGATLGSPSGPLLKGGLKKKNGGKKRQVHFPDNVIKKVDFVQQSQSKVVMRVEYNRPALAYVGAALATILHAVSWCMVGMASFAPLPSNTTAAPTQSTTTLPPYPNPSPTFFFLQDSNNDNHKTRLDNNQSALELARAVAIVLFFAYAATTLIHLLLVLMRRSPTKLERLSFQHPHHMKKLSICVVSGALGLVAKAGSFMMNISSLNLVFFTVWPLIFSYLWYVIKERNFSFVDIVGMVLAVSGTGVLIAGSILRETYENEHDSTRAASSFIAILAAALETLSWNYEKQARRYFSNAIVVFITSSVAMIVVLGISIGLGSFSEPFGPDEVPLMQQGSITARWIVAAAVLMGVAIGITHSTAIYFDTISIMGILSLSGILSVLLYQAFDSLPLIETIYRAVGSAVVGIGCIVLIVSSFVSRRHVELVFSLPKPQVKRKTREQKLEEAAAYENSSPESMSIGTPELNKASHINLDGEGSGGAAAAEFLRNKKNGVRKSPVINHTETFFGSNDEQMPAPLMLTPNSGGHINADVVEGAATGNDASEEVGTRKPSLLAEPSKLLVTSEPSKNPQFPDSSTEFEQEDTQHRDFVPPIANHHTPSSFSPPLSPTETEVPRVAMNTEVHEMLQKK